MILTGIFLCSGCATTPQDRDVKADKKLGLVQEEPAEEAEKSLSQLQEIQAREQKHQLERQITDPRAS